jgi:hypothetical protein
MAGTSGALGEKPREQDSTLAYKIAFQEPVEQRTLPASQHEKPVFLGVFAFSEGVSDPV